MSTYVNEENLNKTDTANSEVSNYEGLTIAKLYDLNETIAADLFKHVTYPWEVLPKIGQFIMELGKTLPEDEYDKVGEDVWIAKDAKVFESAYIHLSGHYRSWGRSASLCIYPRQCHRW